MIGVRGEPLGEEGDSGDMMDREEVERL